MDPKFRRVVEGEKKLSVEEYRDLNNDIFSFIDQMNQTDKKLRGFSNQESDKENQQIFGNSDQNGKFSSGLSAELEKIEIQKRAENERLKGNEFVKSKEYKLAVDSYSKSIDLNGTEAFTYANRAMAYLKLKEYKKVIEDANMALKLKPGYLKAVHRRGKAYCALNKFDEAIRDFQEILEQEPDNKDVNRDLMDAR